MPKSDISGPVLVALEILAGCLDAASRETGTGDGGRTISGRRASIFVL
jgi:hypothetical protein